MTLRILNRNLSRGGAGEQQSERSVHAAAPSERTSALNLNSTSLPVSAVKRRERRAPICWLSASGFFSVLVAVLLSLGLTLVAQPLAIQSADEFFHDGAQCYLTNNLARAREQVDQGLKLFPNDLKLKKLDELLKQQQQQQQQDQQKQEQEKKEQEQKQQQQKQDQKDQQKQDQKDQKKDQKDQQKQEQEQQSKSSGEKDKKEDQKKEAQPMQAHAMTPQEAKQLLDAQKGEEQVLQFKPQEKPERRNRIFKDW